MFQVGVDLLHYFYPPYIQPSGISAYDGNSCFSLNAPRMGHVPQALQVQLIADVAGVVLLVTPGPCGKASGMLKGGKVAGGWLEQVSHVYCLPSIYLILVLRCGVAMQEAQRGRHRALPDRSTSCFFHVPAGSLGVGVRRDISSHSER